MANQRVRYGVSLRKRFMAVQATKRARYKCELCGKTSVKRISNAIWRCRHCNATFAGGAFMPKTEAGDAVSRVMSRIR